MASASAILEHLFSGGLPLRNRLLCREPPKPWGESRCRLPGRAPPELPSNARRHPPTMCVSQVGHPAQASPHQVPAAPASVMNYPRTTRQSPDNPQNWEKI